MCQTHGNSRRLQLLTNDDVAVPDRPDEIHPLDGVGLRPLLHNHGQPTVHVVLLRHGLAELLRSKRMDSTCTQVRLSDWVQSFDGGTEEAEGPHESE